MRTDPLTPPARIIGMDILLGFNAAILSRTSHRQGGFFSRLWGYLLPKSSIQRALGRISKIAVDSRDDPSRWEVLDDNAAIQRDLFGALGRFSQNKAVHFIPRCRRPGRPWIQFMADPANPRGIVVKTWKPDAPGSRAVVAKVFKIPQRNVSHFVNELEALVVRSRAPVPISPVTVFP